ncbi:MAG: MarR family winged helix-turn-helix transcriptional regulator [Pseudodesulfovibrio sp.]
MRSFDELLPVFNLLGGAFTKYSLIDRKPLDFGVGVTLYPSEIHMVSRVDAREGVGVTELAEELGITKGAVSQLISRLEKKGMVAKEPDPDNRVRVLIRTTDLGHVASENHMAFHLSHDREFLEYLAGLDEASYAAVVRLAEEVNRWMDSYC